MTEIKYPAWYDEARTMRAKGASLEVIADKYEFSVSRARQITGDTWKAYIVFQNSANRHPGWTMKDYQREAEKYTFIPDPTRLHTRNKRQVAPVTPRQHVESHFMPAPRDFEVIKKAVEGKVLVGAKIVCCKCHRTEEYYNARGSITPSYLPKEFARLGWSVGKNARHDICPICLKVGTKPEQFQQLEAPIQEKSVVQTLMPSDVRPHGAPVAPVVEKAVVAISKPPAPAPLPTPPSNGVMINGGDMGKTEHRIIFSKLNEIYGDEQTGYTGEWDDSKVAIDLGVPKEWIAKVRDDHFGPETNARMMRSAIDEIVKAGEAIERRMLLIDKKIELMEGLDLKITEASKAVEDTFARFKQLMDSLKIEDDKVEDLITGFNGEVAAFQKMFSELQR